MRQSSTLSGPWTTETSLSFHVTHSMLCVSVCRNSSRMPTRAQSLNYPKSPNFSSPRISSPSPGEAPGIYSTLSFPSSLSPTLSHSLGITQSTLGSKAHVLMYIHMTTFAGTASPKTWSPSTSNFERFQLSRRCALFLHSLSHSRFPLLVFPFALASPFII